MAYTFDENIVSDLHKSARGYRPRDYWWSVWNNSSDDERQVIWDEFFVEMEQEIERERSMHEAAELAFHQKIQGLMFAGAENEITAIRWLLEAEQFDEYDYSYGADYCAYHFGLSYNTGFRELFEEVCAAHMLKLTSSVDNTKV